jgi:hypothetical protein
MISEAELELCRQGYRLWNEGRVEEMVSHCLAPGIEFYPSPDWPGVEPVYRGGAEVARFLREEVYETVGLRGIEIASESCHEDQVIFELLTSIHGELSGIEISEVTIYHVARIEDGRVVRIDAALSPEEAARAIRPRAA